MEFIKAGEAREVAVKSNKNIRMLEELNLVILKSAKLGRTSIRIEYDLNSFESDYREKVVAFLENKGYKVSADEAKLSRMSVVTFDINW